ncbi:MAG: dihydrolipoyl dehydrogenase [Arsenophonus sp.]|nr:MAG: dihydrolipoyl dehydrogenase [Arsenophonus sp.]
MIKSKKTQVVVIGGGPSGYSSAFRSADLGLKTTLVERYPNLGGVCLNVGCIPSKALLHVSKVIEDFNFLTSIGITSRKSTIDIHALSTWKNKIVNRLVNGLTDMVKHRNINFINGLARFKDKNTILVYDTKKNLNIEIDFDYAIIAAGSHSITLPIFSKNSVRVWNSTDALEIKYIPKKLLIVGGGIIGLEMATLYHTLGSNIDIVEIFDQLIPSLDDDIINFYNKQINKKFNIMLKTKILNVLETNNHINVTLKNEDKRTFNKNYDAVLVAIGRKPNTHLIDYKNAGIMLDKHGFIEVDKQMRTNISNIYAVGDIVGHPMLAHKGIHEGHIAAEVISGLQHYFDPRVIPFVSYTNPEISWIGLSEKNIKKQKLDYEYEISIFPWIASGRAVASAAHQGMTKIIFDKKTKKILGASIIGNNSSELIGELVLAMEMGCEAEDVALTIHPHPTLSESIGMSAAIFQGSITDIINVKSKNKRI